MTQRDGMGRGDQDGEHVYTHVGFMSMPKAEPLEMEQIHSGSTHTIPSRAEEMDIHHLPSTDGPNGTNCIFSVCMYMVK